MARPLLLITGALLALGLLGAPAAAQDVTLVDGPRLHDVRVQGGPWKPGKRWVEAKGARNSLHARREIGPGNFVMRATLTLLDVTKSGAAFHIGDSHFCFATGRGPSAISLVGPELHGGKPGQTVLPGTGGRIKNGKRFDFEVRRAGFQLTFLINDDVVHTVKVDSGHLGRIGFAPNRATMRIHEWTVRAHLRLGREFPPAAVLKIQPTIDKAIDTGVQWLLERQNRDGTWDYREDAFRGGMTALATYTLLKAGLPSDHPSVARALAFLEQNPPDRTYVLACHMLAFGATAEARYRSRMQELLKKLVGWQRQGVWGYPHNQPDLSNTQYAALGLRAAHLAGLEVPKQAFGALLRQVLKYQEPERRLRIVRLPDEAAKKGKGTVATGAGKDGKTAVAGFPYRRSGRSCTGSMTAAGVSILAICEQGLGERLGGGLRKQARWAIQKGVEWLGANFAVDHNPGKGRSWLLYYLYGLERVGSLLGLRKIGGRDWYYEGARFLTRKQNKNGSWRIEHEEPDTCFAILFLRRATMIATGERRKKRYDLHIAEDGKHDIRMRASGLIDIGMWITGFGKHVRDQHRKGDGLRIARVEYLVGDKVVATVEGDATKPWSGETFPARHKFERAGEYRVSARAFVMPAKAPKDGGTKLERLTCPGFVVNVPRAFVDWMRLASGKQNLLRGRKLKASATSNGKQARRVTDGLESTHWLCGAKDAAPTLTLELRDPVRANAVVLSQAGGKQSQIGQFDRITRVEIQINRKKPWQVDLEADELQPTLIELPTVRRVKTLRILIVTRVTGRQKGRAGFSEIVLLRR